VRRGSEILKDPQGVQKRNTLGFQVSYLAGDEVRDFVVKDYEQRKSGDRSTNVVVK
jgi:hypothetical protein